MGDIYYKDLVAKFQFALDNNWGYIIGTKGQVWTEKKQQSATDEMAIKYGSKWIGHNVADCSGLFYWAFQELGGNIYHGSNTIWKSYCKTKGKIISGSVLRPGTAVFKLRNDDDYYHIGLYIGDNKVIEAKGTAYGVVKSNIKDWSHWGELKGTTWDSATVATTHNSSIEKDIILTDEIFELASSRQTLKWGMKNDDVKFLQESLNTIMSANIKVDGQYGPKTYNAILNFQGSKCLKTDGIVGKKTWQEIYKALS